MPRPTNESQGRPVRDKRVPVMMNDEEYAIIAEAARRDGTGVSTFLRTSGLGKAKRDKE